MDGVWMQQSAAETGYEFVGQTERKGGMESREEV